MFIGHVAVAFAAKTQASRASLGTYLAAGMFVDLLWPVFLLLGIEIVRVDPGNTAFTPLNFVSYPWSHALVMAIAWSAIFARIHFAIRKDAFTAKVLGGVVFSHWVLDWVTHRPDLPLVPGLAMKTGLGLWNSVPATLIVETTMFFAGVALYARATVALDRAGRLGFVSLVALLVVLYGMASLGPPPKPGQETVVAWMSMGIWVLVPWAAWIDRHRAPVRVT